MREEEYVLDGRGVGHEHCQTVDAHTHSGCRRHTVFERAYKVHIDEHRFVITVVLETELVLEPFVLVNRVVQLAVRIGQFLAAYEKFKPFSKFRIASVPFGERRHFHRIVGDECRLYELVFAIFSEDGVNELSFSE